MSASALLNLVETATVSTSHHTIKLDGGKIVELLRNAGVEIPTGTEVKFKVPGGGDWSGMDCPIDDRNHVTVTWKTERRS